jgi:hypothetical protein
MGWKRILRMIRRGWSDLLFAALFLVLFLFAGHELYGALTTGIAPIGHRRGHTSWFTYQDDPVLFLAGTGLLVMGLFICATLFYRACRKAARHR